MERLSATVVIWGNDNYNVLGLLRQLSPFVGETVFLVNNRVLHCATLSRYCTKYIVTRSTEEAIHYLLKRSSHSNQKAFLITTSDLLASIIDEHQKELSRYYYLSSTREQGVLSKALDKQLQYEIAEEIGIHVPQSISFKWDSPIEEIIYPCLVKPAVKQKGVKHPFKFRVCKDMNELLATQVLLDHSGIYVLQQYIEKEYDVLIYGCRFEDGNVVYAGSFSKYRWSGGDGSYGYVSSSIPVCVETDKVNAFMERINYCGLFSAEFGVKDNTAWFYECNLRNDGTSHYFYQADLENLPLLWIKNHYEKCLPKIEGEKKAIFMDEIGDSDNIGSIISIEEWKKQRRAATVFKYFDRTDKWPYYYKKFRRGLSRIYHIIFK